MLAPMDLAILFGVALVVFGPKRLPELGKSLGQGIGNFKRPSLTLKKKSAQLLKLNRSRPSPRLRLKPLISRLKTLLLSQTRPAQTSPDRSSLRIPQATS